MKKSYIIMALFATLLGFTSCSDDAEPVFEKPTEFKLNTPPLAQQLYELTPDGQLEFTCSQPDYGFTASVTYGIQIALSEDGDTYNVPVLTPTSAVMRVKASDVATGLCVLQGITSADEWVDNGAIPVYVRATAQLGTHGESYITSNWIKLDRVHGYLSLPIPGSIYLIGSPGGWTAPDEANADQLAKWRLLEDENEIGSKVYRGVFDMPAAPMFRFYAKLTGYDGEDSWGSQVDDSPIKYELGADGSLTETLVNGKGSFEFSTFEGGQMTIIVDMNSHKVVFMEGDQL